MTATDWGLCNFCGETVLIYYCLSLTSLINPAQLHMCLHRRKLVQLGAALGRGHAALHGGAESPGADPVAASGRLRGLQPTADGKVQADAARLQRKSGVFRSGFSSQNGWNGEYV